MEYAVRYGTANTVYGLRVRFFVRLYTRALCVDALRMREDLDFYGFFHSLGLLLLFFTFPRLLFWSGRASKNLLLRWRFIHVSQFKRNGKHVSIKSCRPVYLGSFYTMLR